MRRIGFLGTGAMGAPMAKRLLASSYEVTVYDPSDSAVAPLIALGASRAASVADAASHKDMTFACLPSPEVSRAVALGPGGIRDADSPGIYVEMSTIGSTTVMEIDAALSERGIAMLVAPVSGGPRGARAGTLTTMVAGRRENFDRARQILSAIAGNVFYVGGQPGQGQVAKLANNMISAAAMVASFEAVVMAVKSGIDADTLIDIINASTGRCGATLDKFPQSILPRTFDYGGKLSIMYKDVMLCLEEFRSRDVPHHVGASTAQIWFHGMAQGRGDDDYTSLIQVIEDWAGVRVEGKAAKTDPREEGHV